MPKSDAVWVNVPPAALPWYTHPARWADPSHVGVAQKRNTVHRQTPPGFLVRVFPTYWGPHAAKGRPEGRQGPHWQRARRVQPQCVVSCRTEKDQLTDATGGILMIQAQDTTQCFSHKKGVGRPSGLHYRPELHFRGCLHRQGGQRDGREVPRSTSSLVAQPSPPSPIPPTGPSPP